MDKETSQDIKKLLTDDDILKIIGNNAKVITYPEIKNFKKLNDLFGKCTKIIILYINEIDEKGIVGHWCLLTKTKRNNKVIIDFMDPYGYLPDDILSYYTDEWRIESGQDKNYLTKLLYDYSLNNKHEIHYNELPLQLEKKDINTCGRWVAVRGFFHKVPLNAFQNVFKKLKNEGYNLDVIITKLSNMLLNK